MITFFSNDFNISQKHYSNSLNLIDFDSIECSCHNTHCLSIHAYYLRFVKSPIGRIPIRILRVKCSVCGITHAVIPASIIPYTQHSFHDTLRVFIHFQHHPFFRSSFLDSVPSIAFSDVYHLKGIFSNWISFLSRYNINLSNPPNDIISLCFFHLNRNLSQMRFNNTDLFITT